TLGFFRLRGIQKWIEPVNFATGRWLSVLSQCLELGFDELTERAVLESFDDGPGSRRRHIENALARHQPACFIDFTKQRCFFNGRAQQGERTYRCPAHGVRRIENAVPDAKP